MTVLTHIQRKDFEQISAVEGYERRDVFEDAPNREIVGFAPVEMIHFRIERLGSQAVVKTRGTDEKVDGTQQLGVARAAIGIFVVIIGFMFANGWSLRSSPSFLSVKMVQPNYPQRTSQTSQPHRESPLLKEKTPECPTNEATKLW